MFQATVDISGHSCHSCCSRNTYQEWPISSIWKL